MTFCIFVIKSTCSRLVRQSWISRLTVHCFSNARSRSKFSRRQKKTQSQLRCTMRYSGNKKLKKKSINLQVRPRKAYARVLGNCTDFGRCVVWIRNFGKVIVIGDFDKRVDKPNQRRQASVSPRTGIPGWRGAWPFNNASSVVVVDAAACLSNGVLSGQLDGKKCTMFIHSRVSDSSRALNIRPQLMKANRAGKGRHLKRN